MGKLEGKAALVTGSARGTGGTAIVLKADVGDWSQAKASGGFTP
jgi:hypothetical protein